MARQFSTTIRNDWLDRWESNIGASAILEIFTGAAPANCAAADSGTKLVSITLPADWMDAAASGSKAKLGTWSATAIATGNAAHYRLKSSGGTVHEQGTVTAGGGGGDMTLDSASATITSGNTVTIGTYTTTAPGA